MEKPTIKKIRKDTGFSASDLITASNTLTLEGTADPRARIVVFDGFGKLIGTVRADKNGKWLFDTPTLIGSDHDFQVEARKNGHFRKSEVASVQIDTEAHTPAITGLSDDSGISGDHVTNDTTLLLTGTAEAGAKVKVSHGGTHLGTTVADGAGGWSLATGVLGQGAQSFTAKMTDIAGNSSGPSVVFAVTIDTTAPSAPSKPDLAAASDTGGSNTDNITRDTTPTLNGTAEARATIIIKDGATVLGSTVAGGGGTWSFTTAALGEGAHSFTATATDKAGNSSAASSALSIVVDTTVPAAPSAPDLSAASDSGTSSADNVTTDKTPTLTGTAESGATITIRDGIAVLATTLANSVGQ